MLLGVDTGGTFTDFVLLTEQGLRIHKVLSTPQAPEQAIVQGMQDLAVSLDGLQVIHGSTVATNALLEGNMAPTVLVTNAGFKDQLSIGRQARRELYNLQPKIVPEPVPEAYCLEVHTRLTAQGELIEPLDKEEVAALVAKIERLQPRAVAINLLFSFLDDRQEKQIAEALPETVFVTRSSQILKEFREYERGVATWLNAALGPLVQGYLQRLVAAVQPAKVAVMLSHGGTMAAQQAGQEAVNMLLSGPAGGLMAAQFIGEQCDQQRLLSFDMGGTSTDVALIDGEIAITTEAQLAHWPIAVPMVDMYTIGAGGGSIATVDAGGLLQVGPRSAGAHPGPACYGKGGTLPSVTDANLILGRLKADAFLGGAMHLDLAAARNAMESVAQALGCSVEQAAEGVIEVANEHMSRALRVISVQRGVDPSEFALLSFGGAGGLHVCALAESLRMTQAIVPIHAGVLSALGMLVAPRTRYLSQTLNGLIEEIASEAIESAMQHLQQQAIAALAEEGLAQADLVTHRYVDLRYFGQSYSLTVPWQGQQASQASFHNLHETRYGHALDQAVELVNVRVRVQGPAQPIALAPLTADATEPRIQHTQLWGVDAPVPVFERQQLPAGYTLDGPALITETVATTWVAPGWQLRVLANGCLLMAKI